MRKLFFLLSLLLLLTGAAVYWFIGTKGFTVQIKESEIQMQLDEQFPIVKDGIIGKLQISDPKVEFSKAKRRALVDFIIEGDSFLTGEIFGKGSLSGAFRYVREEASLYLDDALVNLELEGESEERRLAIETAATTLARDYFRKYPIHSIDDVDLKSKLTRAYLLQLDIEDKGLRLHFGRSPKDS